MTRRTENDLTHESMLAALQGLANPVHAQALQRFFRTGPGQYGEGDIFLGIKVPYIRSLIRIFSAAPLGEILKLIRSPLHEARLLALLLMVTQYDKSDEEIREKIFSSYLRNARYVNNWDLVDLSAPHILGRHLMHRDRAVLRTLAGSQRLWDRRIAVLATFFFIKYNDFSDSLHIAEMLVDDAEDLIRKAVGWMMREIGKRDAEAAETFLLKHCRTMPRTMLRYAIERYPEEKRLTYLHAGKLSTGDRNRAGSKKDDTDQRGFRPGKGSKPRHRRNENVRY